METFTNGMISPREAPTSTTIVRRSVANPQAETNEKSSELVAASKLEWRWKGRNFGSCREIIAIASLSRKLKTALLGVSSFSLHS